MSNTAEDIQYKNQGTVERVLCGGTTTVQSSPIELRRRSGDVEVDILVCGTTP